MSQNTKTVSKIKVLPESMAQCCEDQLNASLQQEEATLHGHADGILALVKQLIKSNAWVYMENMDVYYIPRIVGVMPNLERFNTTAQQCSNASFNAPTVEQMAFAGFSGDFPTAHEAKCCFGNQNVYCVDGKCIKVKGTNHDGVTVNAKKYFACYNLYRDKKLEKYGDGSSSDYGWNIPIFRFNGEDSEPILLGQTALYWLKFGLRPDNVRPNSELRASYDYLATRKDYLLASGDMLLLDVNKLRDDIRSGKEINWLPKEVTGIFTSKIVRWNNEITDNYKKSLLQCDQQAIALDPYDEKILTDPNRGHWDLWDK